MCHHTQAAAKKATLLNLKPTTKTISLRLPQHVLDSLKVAAIARDVPHQLLFSLTPQTACASAPTPPRIPPPRRPPARPGAAAHLWASGP
ncbi:MAG: CopG family antitoxin [Burkholderiaceae bacterium]|nr:CopG family antitoxin [Burkholderiaceae bacterium]